MQAWVEQWLPGFGPGDENETNKGDERMSIIATITETVVRGPEPVSVRLKDYTKYQRDLMNPRIRSLENAARQAKKRACDVVLQIRDDLLAVRESILKADADTSLELVDTLLDNIENHISER